MKFSERWLRQWVPGDSTTAELCERLTNAGLEVDGAAPVGEPVPGVVVAEIVAVAPHPNADRLSVCQVDAGAGVLDVVCGAPNARAGLKTALAPIGVKLPSGLPICSMDVRGVTSAGNLCSELELGFGGGGDALIDIDAGFGAAFGVAEEALRAGGDLREALALDDVTIDLDLTPNRGDCLGLRGLAREVGLLEDRRVAPPDIPAVAPASERTHPVEIVNGAGCPRYLGRVIEGVDASRRAPLWLRERLRRSGLRSIDPIVDVTNYVLLELGQPMHAFDLDALEGGVVVRDASAGERLTMLDGQRIALGEGVLLIADQRGPVAIAGVMGGERSGVAAGTRNVFLECAFFAPTAVARTARRFGLHTDAAHRYERGVDFRLQAEAMERATALLLAIAGGRAGPVAEALDEAALPRQRMVTLRKARLRRLVGEEIPDGEVERILARLDLAPQAQGKGDAKTWRAKAPSHRFDLEREEDLVEEVLRIHGYDAIASRMPAAKLALGGQPADEVPDSRFADLLVDLGYAEAITYSFVDPKLADLLDPAHTPRRIVNPVSSDHAALRANLLPGLVTALRRNLARQAGRVRLFEIGQCFPAGAAASPERDGAMQTTLCGGILYGPREPESWAHDGAPVDFFDVKGDVERLLALGGREAKFAPAKDPALHPGQSAVVLLNESEPIGRLGRLHPELEAALDLPSGVFVFELRLEAVAAALPRRFKGLSRFPAMRRDLAVVVDEDVPAGRIEAVLRRELSDLAAEVKVFDLYAGDGVDPGKKSVAVGVTLRDRARTLEDWTVQTHVERAVAALGKELGARLR